MSILCVPLKFNFWKLFNFNLNFWLQVEWIKNAIRRREDKLIADFNSKQIKLFQSKQIK